MAKYLHQSKSRLRVNQEGSDNMTAREVIKILKNNYPKTCRMVNGRYQGGFDDTESDFGQALTMAISALEEIQQYREIGTVEECRADREKQSPKKPRILVSRGGKGGKYCVCPSCGGVIGKYIPFCRSCGQANQWEESKEE